MSLHQQEEQLISTNPLVFLDHVGVPHLPALISLIAFKLNSGISVLIWSDLFLALLELDSFPSSHLDPTIALNLLNLCHVLHPVYDLVNPMTGLLAYITAAFSFF